MIKIRQGFSLKWQWLAFIAVSFVLQGCWQREGLAPVVESTWRGASYNASQHVVMRGETLYAIAFRYDKDYRQLALLNHLPPPYTVRVGQMIRINPGYSRGVPQVTRRRINPPLAQPRVWQHRAALFHSRQTAKGAWIWPAKGRLASSFVPQQGKKGINIAGYRGQKIMASKNGVVAYSGDGLSGYGNLIIIKHDNQLLTAYGHNQRNLVREGQVVKAGQVIAEMGLIENRYWGVHFEIRQSGRPVNPLQYLH